MKKNFFVLIIVLLFCFALQSHAKPLSLEKMPGVKSKSFKAFTLNDIRRASKNTRIKLTDEILLKNGRKIEVNKALAQLNGIEKWLNTYGRSLREDTIQPPIIGRVELSMKSKQKATPILWRDFQIAPRGEPCNGLLMSPPEVPWDKSYGDADVIQVTLQKQLAGTNEIYGVSGKGHMGVDVTIAGNKYTLVAIDNQFFLPQGGSDMDTMRFGSASLTLFDTTIPDTKNCENQATCSVQLQNSISKKIKATEFVIAYIVVADYAIPVKILFSVDGEVSGKVGGSAAPLNGEVMWEASAALNGRAECFIDLEVVKAGMGANVNILTGTLSESGKATLSLPYEIGISGTRIVDVKRGTTVEWAHTQFIEISALSGKIYLFLTIEMPGLLSFISKKFTIELYSWSGEPIFENPELESITVCRPTANDNKHVYCMNEDNLVDIGFDRMNCGGCGVSCGMIGHCGREPQLPFHEIPGVCTLRSGVTIIEHFPESIHRVLPRRVVPSP